MNKQSPKIKKSRKKAILISVICAIVSIPLVMIPVMTVIIYESIFSFRCQTELDASFSVEEFDGLFLERSDFSSDGACLAGYKYSSPDTKAKGVVVLSHGLGGGGQNGYMPIIAHFVTQGYYVFAYDAHGNDNSEGDDIEGLPQGVIDLDNAIRHVKEIPEYNELPIMLFGHSWGGYSVGNVLNIHPDIKAAVIVAGFNESEDMLLFQSQKYVGALANVLLPYVELYEKIKFGSEYTSISAISGMSDSGASILLVQSSDDTIVPSEYGYEKFYKSFKSDERFEFILYKKRGHTDLLYSEDAIKYREALGRDYYSYLEKAGLKDTESAKNEFMQKNLDKKNYFELNSELMSKIIELYDNSSK